MVFCCNCRRMERMKRWRRSFETKFWQFCGRKRWGLLCFAMSWARMSRVMSRHPHRRCRRHHYHHQRLHQHNHGKFSFIHIMFILSSYGCNHLWSPYVPKFDFHLGTYQAAVVQCIVSGEGSEAWGRGKKWWKTWSSRGCGKHCRECRNAALPAHFHCTDAWFGLTDGVRGFQLMSYFLAPRCGKLLSSKNLVKGDREEFKMERFTLRSGKP